MKLPGQLQDVVSAVRQAGGRALIVGGAVRDAMLGLEPKDFDVEVYDLELATLIHTLEAVGKINQVGKSFGVLKVVMPDFELDVSLPRRESKAGRGHRGFIVKPDSTMTPKEAASRRDFTINAVAFDSEAGEFLDFFGGRHDLESKVLRHVGPAFADDPLRVLRGMQFAGRFELRAEPTTIQLSQDLFGEYSTLPVERIWAEWFKWAARSTRPSMGLQYLKQCGWWEAYPELRALDGCPQEPDWHPEGDVWTHTLLVTDAAAGIGERDGLEDNDRVALVLAALCHDLGKPQTTVVQDGRVRSPGHWERCETYEKFLHRIGCPQKIVERVVALSRHHMAHMDFVGSSRHVRRLARALGEGGETIEMLGVWPTST